MLFHWPDCICRTSVVILALPASDCVFQ